MTTSNMPFDTDLQATVFYNTYSRWDNVLGRRETWPETTERVVTWVQDHIAREYSSDAYLAIPWQELHRGMMNLDVLPSMRLVQMAGPSLDRCHVGAYNCAYLPLKDWQSFSELLYILMQGTGCGFSVESKYVDMFDTIKPQSGESIGLHIIKDTTEGWCDALHTGLVLWAGGNDLEFDYSQIRPYGSPLKTKGGKASGPEPLKQLLDYARTMVLRHQGRKLSSLNLHDLACYCGSIVQVGGVRRSAEISLSDLHDARMTTAKQGQFWLKANERNMANNSAVYTSKPDLRTFTNEWLTMIENGTGERGLFNRGDINQWLPARRERRDDWGINPCGEIILRPFQFCNLSIAVARPKDDPAQLREKVRLAAIWGTLQSTLTTFNYIRPEWQENCEQERLLGVDITGQMDNQFIKSETHRANVYNDMRSTAVLTNREYADILGIPHSTAVTCVKPSGNSSQLLNVSSGIHPRYAPYYIRRIRIGASSPLCAFLRKAGVPCSPEVGQVESTATVWVFEFPVKSPEGALCRQAAPALTQLTQWLACKQFYTEHNPSCTVYVKDEEWLEVASWVYTHWEKIGGLSFLPYDGGVYQLAPYEQIEQSDYEKRLKQWPQLDWSKLAEFETEDTTELNREFACTGDKCEI